MKSPDEYPVRVDRRVFVEMEDGVRIAVTTYLPDAAGDGPFPAIVESLPYRKDDDCTARDFSTYSYLASKGFAGIRIDVRGTGASTGIIDDEYLAIEQADNLEVLMWAEEQDWCTGDIGMWGISWGGFSALQTAMLRPSQLKAIVAMHATHDRFACDVHYTGGSLHAAEQVDWPPSMITTNALPPDPDIFGDGWKDEWLRRLDATPQWPLQWLRHQERDSYWLHGSPCADYSSIATPTLLIGGWLDGYIDGMLALAENLECPTKAVIGPWGHYRPSTGEPGPTYDHYELLARWFGHHLRGDDNGVMDIPTVTAFIRTGVPYDAGVVTGYWREEPAWPPLDAVELSLPLEDMHSNQTEWSGPQWVGAHAPAWDRSGITSGDSNRDDEHSITFTSRPLEESLEILGTPEVDLTLATDQAVGLVAARLLIVETDGSTHLICRGNRNLAFPESLSDPRPLHPNEKVRVRFPLLATSAVVPVGASVRLAISGADFPVVWPPPRKFRLELEPTSCFLHLPTIPLSRVRSRLVIPPAPPAPVAPVESVRDDASWSVDIGKQRSTFKRHIESEEIQAGRNDLTYSVDQQWEVAVDNDDPGSTMVHARSFLTLSRPGWHVTTEGTIDIRGADALRVVIELVATHDGEEVWSRRWEDTVAREWV